MANKQERFNSLSNPPASQRTSWTTTILTLLSYATAICASVAYLYYYKLPDSAEEGHQVGQVRASVLPRLGELPPQAVFIDPKSFSVLGCEPKFRASSFSDTQFFNPSSTQPPFFQIFDPAFLTVLGPNATIYEIASNDTFAFAHEAPIYDPVTDQVFFASNAGGPLSGSGLERNNQVAKISMKEVDAKLEGLPPGTAINTTVTKLDLPDTLQMTNGGTGPYHSSLLFINSGRGPHAPSITLVNPSPPHNATVLLDNYYGRQFNSLNDIKVHPSGNLFFTDVTYGYFFGFRSAPRMPNQVYRFDPTTGAVRAVATDFDKPNGIAFSPDGKTSYIADTGALSGFLKPADQTAPATIYAFDVDPYTHAFTNRRVFAYADTGIPDGIQVDTDGNVYSGCGDGVHVWDDRGTLLGKFFTGYLTPNMVFAGDGRLFILSEFKIYVAYIAAKHVAALFP
ncbi:hypothetical protein AX15_002224 [Amanita polypyramis BW_CC]|nr:hypothetical protein AX15_002224 [Amanita polypyramis BW_CC]